MAKFKNKQDEEEAHKTCINCGNRGFHIDLKTNELVCDNCWLSPDILITLDGYLSDINQDLQPSEELRIKLLREKEGINKNYFTVIFGYSSEEADYWYSIECFNDKIALTEYLYRNFTGCSKDEDGDDDCTRHVIKIYHKGKPIDFRIELNEPSKYYDPLEKDNLYN
jgi:hypothetical protein